MPPVTPWSDDDDQTLRDLHAAGMTLTAIAEEMDRGKATIHRYAAKAGLSFDRSKTKAATEAKKIDAAARRVALEERYLIEADKLLDQLWEPCTIHSFGGKDNTYAEEVVDRPPFKDQRDIIHASSTAAGAANRLRDMAVDGEASAVDQWVGDMLGRPKPTADDSPEIAIN